MASLQVRNKTYYIVFSKRYGDDFTQKKFSLRTKIKRKATKLRIEFEELYEKGQIDPFGSWSPKKHFEKNTRTSQSVITLSELKNMFIDQRKHVRQVTRNNYKRHLNMLEKELGSSIPVFLITENDMSSFCFQGHLSVATQASYITHYSAFFTWLIEKGVLEKSPMENIKKPKVPANISQKTINDIQLKLIFKAHRDDMHKKRVLKQITTRAQYRLWFRPVISIAYYGGLRVKEVVQLRWENVDLERRQITLTGTKSGDERVVPIRKELLQILTAWKKFDPYKGKGLVFPSETGLNGLHPMSGGNISKVFRKYVDMAGLPGTVNFHGLRHSCGTELLRMGYDINEVAKILGHSSLDVTRIYEHLTPNDLSIKLKNIENRMDQDRNKENDLEVIERRLYERERKLNALQKKLLEKEAKMNRSK